jgi:hypothetical protein
MDVNNEIRELVLKNSSTDSIRAASCRAGMRTLAEDGRRLVQEGVTTIEEVLSVTTVHELAATAPITTAAGSEVAPAPARTASAKR